MTTCSQPRYDIIKYDSNYVGIHTYIYGLRGIIVVCTTAVLGNDSIAVQNVSLCDTNKVSKYVIDKITNFIW